MTDKIKPEKELVMKRLEMHDRTHHWKKKKGDTKKMAYYVSYLINHPPPTYRFQPLSPPLMSQIRETIQELIFSFENHFEKTCYETGDLFIILPI